MYISPILTYYSAQNSADVIQDYMKMKENFSHPQKDEVENTAVFIMNTRRNISDLSDYVSRANIENLKEQSNIEGKKHKNIRNAPILDRVNETVENFKEGNILSGLATGTLGILYGPEDLREVKSAYEQIKTFAKGKKFIEEYDYKNAQHPYSFFRGSILHDKMNPLNNEPVTKNPKLNKKIQNIKFWLIDNDKALIDTKWGKEFLRKNDIKMDKIPTPIDEVGSTPKNPSKVDAYKFISNNKLANLTARAMTRTSAIGALVDAGIDGIKALEEIEKGKEIIPTIAKSAFNFITSAITTGYLGAIGSKFGPFGSLCAITLANHINEKIEEITD